MVNSVEAAEPVRVPGIPLFTIGITTFKRHDRLRCLLEMIRSQTFTDFEVIVGNDCLEETLSAKDFGLEDDPRFRFVNHPRNLGELDNMNALLHLAKGRYFTWQFDDDGYSVHFLEAVGNALVRFDYPLCVVPMAKHIVGESIPEQLCKSEPSTAQLRLVAGHQFLGKLRSGTFPVMGYNCVFDTETLRSNGGVRRLSPCPYALFFEYVLLLQIGLLERVAIITRPLVFYLAHQESWTERNEDLPLLMSAGRKFIRECVGLLRHSAIRADFGPNLSYCLDVLVHGCIAPKLVRPRPRISLMEVDRYILSLSKEFKQLEESQLYDEARATLRRFRLFAVVKILSRRLLPERWLMRHLGWHVED